MTQFAIHNPLDLAFIKALMDAENGIRKGYKQGLWFPHKSLEGGTDTIAYGHKLTTSEQDGRVFQYGITDEAACELFLLDLGVREDQIRNLWNSFHNQDLDFDNMPVKYQYILLDLIYNVGKSNVATSRWKWPKLAQAIKDGDDHGVYKESVRSYKDNVGRRIYLWTRTESICNAVGVNYG